MSPDMKPFEKEEKKPPAKLIGRLQHCGMPIDHHEGETKLFCMGCHEWHQADKLEKWEEPKAAPKAPEVKK